LGGLAIGINALLLIFMFSIYFLERSGVRAVFYLLLRYSSCELLRFIIEGRRTRDNFYTLELLFFINDLRMTGLRF
jgi:hypothetical protein